MHYYQRNGRRSGAGAVENGNGAAGTVCRYVDSELGSLNPVGNGYPLAVDAHVRNAVQMLTRNGDGAVA